MMDFPKHFIIYLFIIVNIILICVIFLNSEDNLIRNDNHHHHHHHRKLSSEPLTFLSDQEIHKMHQKASKKSKDGISIRGNGEKSTTFLNPRSFTSFLKSDPIVPKDDKLSFLDPNFVKTHNDAHNVKKVSNKHPQKKPNGDINLQFITDKKDHPSFSSNKVPGKPTRTEKMETNELETFKSHPFYSPRKGTDISPNKQEEILLLPNQSNSIVPELQLSAKLKIYLCKHPVRSGVRFYFLTREGLLLHPNVELLEEKDINKADYIFYLPGSAPWHLTECTNASFASKLVVLDEFDGPTPLFSPARNQEEYNQRYGGPAVPWYHMYFKRSFVRRLDGKFLNYPHLKQRDVYPLTYSIAEAYIPHTFNQKRDIDILCTLRGSKHMSTRLRVQEWVAEYGQTRNVTNFRSGQLNTATRTTVNMEYFQSMFNSKIIVTVNPAQWEGDFRLWESLCSGALVFVDPLFVPHQYPLIHGEHVIYFSNSNKTDLWSKLDYYRNHPDEARRIAINGYLHAMKYHRTVNMIDYFLRTLHAQKAALDSETRHNPPHYTYTGQFLNHEAKIQERMIKQCDKPGIYEPSQDLNQVPNRLTCPAPTIIPESDKLGNIAFQA